MRPTASALALAGPALVLALTAPCLVAAAPGPENVASVRGAPRADFAMDFGRRDGMDMHEHGHGHGHAAPLTELNETQILEWHSATLPSYWTIDIEERDPATARYPWLMALHVFLMSVAFFGALPAGIALRSVKHAWHGAAVAVFWAAVVLACAASALYRKLTPDMYEHASHSRHGYTVLFIAAILSVIDGLALIVRLVAYVQACRTGERQFAIKTLWTAAVLGRDEKEHAHAEYSPFVVAEPDELEPEAHELLPKRAPDSPAFEIGEDAQWANSAGLYSVGTARPHGSHSPRGSVHSDDTLHDSHHSQSHAEQPQPAVDRRKRARARRIGLAAFATAERALVFAGFAQVLEGIVVYTGGCRGNYLNGCLAHLIKGGIFWCYGLASFARFVGAFADWGWAWNISPLGAGSAPTAEFVESAVVFFYGITNTWMERFGAHAGDPYTTKQIQHIGIAVMFWFAGLVGMGIESKRVRRWLALGTTAGAVTAHTSVEEPASYRGSFNPFPALVIGVTGAAMSAHFQTYLFQVQIHDLWGKFLGAFAVLRCLTYFFVWLNPPRSVLPSRPPTEALASFFLAAGGLTFMLSDEEVTFAAMRKGRDDVMMFMNVAVAITCFAFCWTLVVVAFKGWLKSRTTPAPSFRAAA